MNKNALARVLNKYKSTNEWNKMNEHAVMTVTNAMALNEMNQMNEIINCHKSNKIKWIK